MYKRVKLYNKSKFKKSKIPNFLNRRGKNEDVTNLIKFMVEKNTGLSMVKIMKLMEVLSEKNLNELQKYGFTVFRKVFSKEDYFPLKCFY